MGQALYRKYRSKSFSEVVGQDHITKTLQNAIKAGKISHAFLFTGPRGVGKTSVARILAHEVNSLPYTDESIHLDIIEIDAASNRRIDEIRDLRDKVRIAPTSAKYKVYIIDEVHMLTKEAFNALLKTLEEPPAHCIFILATTESHKLPETIISRTQRFEFKPVVKSQGADHLKNMAKQENIKIDQEALNLLAEFGNGSFRDSISYLDQLSSTGKEVTASEVRQLLGLPTDQEVVQLMQSLNNGDSAGLISQLKLIEQGGVTATALASILSEQIRGQVISGSAKTEHLGLMKALLEVSASPRAQELLEITLLEFTAIAAPKVNPTPPNITPQQTPRAPKEEPVMPIKKVEEQTVKPKPANKIVSGNFSLDNWQEVVELSKKTAASIYTALRLAEPSFEDGVLTLGLQFPLHQKKLDQAKNKHLIADLIEQVCGVKVSIEVVVNKNAAPSPAKITTNKPVVNSAISNIFGNTELVEG